MRCFFKVRGQVQGIGYRYFVIQTAKKLSLTGWVRNCPNGNVETEAQGTEKNLRDFKTQLESGHSFAHVTQMIQEPIPEKKGEKYFKLEY